MQRWSHPIHLVLGFAMWGLWFLVMYGGLSVACAVAPPEAAPGNRTWLNQLLLLLTLTTSVALLYAAVRCWRARPTPNDESAPTLFIRQLGGGLYLAATLATLAVGLPVAVLMPCS